MGQMLNTRFWTGTEINRDGQTVPTDYVEYKLKKNADGMVPSSATVEKVRRMNPDNVHLPEGADGGDKLRHMRIVWAEIEPDYRAWKEGREIPDNGTPLAIWTQLTQEDAEIFRISGIKTVEGVAELTDNAASRIRMPNVYDLRKLAKMFLDNQKASDATAKEVALMETIAALKARLDEIDNRPVAAGDDEVDALRAELDAREIAYDKRIRNPEKLRAILNSVSEEAAA